ncbi:MAG: class I SAM-dependent methyltransferase [Saprospiraceae bacterium]
MKNTFPVPIENYSSKLTANEEGWWKLGSQATVSYTENGHAGSYALENASFWYLHRNEIITQAIQQFPAKWLLDVGGGTGFVSHFLQQNNIKTVLLEPVLAGAQLSKQRQIQQVICGSLQEVDFHPNSLPAIGMFDVLEHIEDDISFLKDCHQVLQADGRLYLTVPAYQSLWSSFDQHVGHYRRYNLTDLQQKLERLGFVVEFKSYFFSFLPPFVWLKRVLLKKDYHLKENKKSNDHLVQSSRLRQFLLKFLSIETSRIKRKKTLPFGTSCLVVARKLA